MGLTHIMIEVANPSEPDSRVTVKCFLDSGLHHIILPREVLAAISITPLSVDSLRLPDGSSVRRERGAAVVFCHGHTGTCSAVFGEEGDEQLCGAFTLEALGLALDPLRRELKPMQLLM